MFSKTGFFALAAAGLASAAAFAAQPAQPGGFGVVISGAAQAGVVGADRSSFGGAKSDNGGVPIGSGGGNPAFNAGAKALVGATPTPGKP